MIKRYDKIWSFRRLAALTVCMGFFGLAGNPLLTGAATSAGQSMTRLPFIRALIGDRLDHLDAERSAGFTARVVRVSWKDFEPTPLGANIQYNTDKQRQLRQLRNEGFKVIVDLGLQDTPPWLHHSDADSYYVDQFNDIYNPGIVDSGDANLVFNRGLRARAENYIGHLLARLGPLIDFVRIGGGHWGELGYPAMRYHGHSNCYWSFDRLALASNPTPIWRPGDPSRNGEAHRFVDWYLDQLADYQNWQIRTVRRSFAGPIMVLYPSWGIRPGQLAAAIRVNLCGSTSAEINGEVTRGYDFQRQIDCIHDANVIVASTWLDADGSGDDGPDPARWSPIHYLSLLAGARRPNLRLFGENTGHGSPAALAFTAAQARRFGLCGFAWFRQEELDQPGLASLKDYQNIASERN
jgi:hypothetical protein